MQRSLVITTCWLAIAAAISTWFWWPRDVTSPDDRLPTTESDPGLPESDLETISADDITHIPIRSPSPAAHGPGEEIRITLRGTHALAPWTQPLRVDLSDRKRKFATATRDVAINADGEGAIALPSWWQPDMQIRLQVCGKNPGYRPLIHRQHSALPPDEILAISVQPVAKVRGRITGPRGQPIQNARIAAFAMQNGQPADDMVGTTGSDDQGHYRLLAPPDSELLIVVCAMQPNAVNWRRDDGVCDNGCLASHLLPTCRAVQLTVGQPVGCDFSLADASAANGSVVWPDQTPVAAAMVRFQHQGGTRLTISHQAEVRWQPGGAVQAGGVVTSDAQGRFCVPASDASEVTLSVVAVDGTRIVGQLPEHQVTVPATPKITLPFPVTLRAIYEDQLVPHARVLVHGDSPHRARPDGTLSLLLATEAIVRTEQGPVRSAWLSLASNQLRQTVDMIMENRLVELEIELDGEVPIHNAHFHWRCTDGRRATELLTRHDTGSPFGLLLEPGDYSLRVSAGNATDNSNYLIAVKRSFNTRQTNRLVLPARFGGKFVLQVIDTQGHYVAGRCTVRGIDGAEHLLDLNVEGQPGAFAATTTRCNDVLPAGPYELVIDVGGPSKHRRYMQIKPFETTPVVLRL